MEEKPKITVIKPDFKDKNVVQFLRDMAGIAKRGDVRSALVLTVDATGHTDWLHLYESEHHACLMALALPDAADDLKSEIFNEYLD